MTNPNPTHDSAGKLVDSVLKPTEWRVYRGVYDKKFYDLRLHGDSLTTYHNCWPKDGKFYWNGSEISGDMVYKIRETPKENTND